MKTRNFVTTTVQAILVWLLTNIIASLLYFAATFVGIEFDPFLCYKCTTTLSYILFFALLFSSPVILLLIPNLYIIQIISSRKARIYYSLLSILICCSIVVVAFINIIGQQGYSLATISTFLLPYLIAARASFQLIASKTIYSQVSKSFV